MKIGDKVIYFGDRYDYNGRIATVVMREEKPNYINDCSLGLIFDGELGGPWLVLMDRNKAEWHDKCNFALSDLVDFQEYNNILKGML